ncbi:MAG: hypothetical protein JOY80_06690 [Candidatus Dormibacteraeota bacterium]|nr:hypothetical protein [Candidatus Dormibacteraeota bacterium]
MFRALGARVLLDSDDGAPATGWTVGSVWDWATHGLEGAPPRWAEGEHIIGTTRIRCLRAADGDQLLLRTTLHRPDEWEPTIVWRSTVDLLEDDGVVEVGIAVEQDLRHHRIAPTPLQPPLLSLLHSLALRGTRAGSQPVSAEAQTIVGTESVARFVDRVLLDRERQLPVLLFTSVKEREGVYMPEGTNPSLVARELCGLAHVYLIPRAEDTHKLTRRLRLLSAYDGAVRIYWPRMTVQDSPPRHPLHLRTRLNHTSVPAIERRIIEAGARAYRPPDGTAALIARRWRAEQRERLDMLMAAETDSERREAVLISELLQVTEENVRLTQDLETVRDELERALRRLEEQTSADPAVDAFSGDGQNGDGQSGVEAMKSATI